MTKAKKRRGKRRTGAPAAKRAPGTCSAQQLAFCVAFIANGGNGTQAALDAGYAAAGAKVRAHRLLAIPHIRDKIAELTARAATEAAATVEAAGVTAIAEQAVVTEAEASKVMLAVEQLRERVMRRIESIAFTELPELATWTEDAVTFTPSDQLSETARGSVKAIKSKMDEVITDEGDKILRRTTMEVRQHDPMPALKELMTLVGMRPKDEKPAGQQVAVGVQVIVSGGPTGIETGAISSADHSKTIPAPPQNIAPAAENIAAAPVAGPRPWNPGKKPRTPHASPLSAIAERARAALGTSGTSPSPEV